MINLLATHCSIARSTCHQDFGIENMGGESKEGHDELPTQTTNKILRSLVGGFNPSEKHESNWESFPKFRGEKQKIFGSTT